MVPSALLHFGLAVILQYVMATDVLQNIFTLINDKQRNLSNPEKVVVESDEITYHVLLINVTSGLYFCGGTQLSNPYVLTAAECVINREIYEIRVHAGRKKFNQTTIWYMRTIREIIIHDEYDPLKKWHNDIALLRMTSYFPSDIKYGNVPNYYGFKQLKNLERPLLATVSGYGIISENKKPTSHQMLQANSFVPSWEDCNTIFANIPYNISNSVICAFDNKNDNRTRISDVGSPLICNYDVIGIALSANWGVLNLGSFNSPYPLLFTNTSFYKEWINLRIVERLPFDNLNVCYDARTCRGS